MSVLGIIVLVPFFVIQVGGSVLIGNTRVRFAERNPLNLETVGLLVTEAELCSPDVNRGLLEKMMDIFTA